MSVTADGPEVTITLSRFLRALPTSVRVLHAGPGEAAVRWVGPSELDDPTPYLVPEEVLSISGMPFLADPDDSERIDRYVQALVRAEVCALGLGPAPHHDRVPPAVIEACIRHDLGLFEVPSDVPFAAIGLEFAQLMVSSRSRALRELNGITRRLLSASMSARPEHELLAARLLPAPAAPSVVGAAGGLGDGDALSALVRCCTGAPPEARRALCRACPARRPERLRRRPPGAICWTRFWSRPMRRGSRQSPGSRWPSPW